MTFRIYFQKKINLFGGILVFRVYFLRHPRWFGSNIYANPQLQEAGLLKIAQVIKLSANILIGITVVYKIRSIISLIGIGIWIVLSFATFHASELHAAEIAYISFCCLFLTSVLLYFQIQNKKEEAERSSDINLLEANNR